MLLNGTKSMLFLVLAYAPCARKNSVKHFPRRIIAKGLCEMLTFQPTRSPKAILAWATAELNGGQEIPAYATARQNTGDT